MENCLAACKRFGAYVKPVIVDVIGIYSAGNLFDLLTSITKEYIPSTIHYMATINELLPFLCKNNNIKQEISNNGIFDHFLNLCSQEADDLKLPPDERLTAINLACDIWALNPLAIENSEDLSKSLLNTLERVSRDKSYLLKISCMGKLFHLLQEFTVTRNSFAPMIYKIITFSLIENYSEELIREFILQNFIPIFAEFPEIPLKILLEPLIKHLKISKFLDFNTSDFFFFISLSQHPKLNFKIALQLMDILAKIYIEHLEFCEIIGEIFLAISERFIDIEPLQQYLIYLFRFYLKYIETPSTVAEEKNKVVAIMELIAGGVRLHSDNVNQNIKFLICDMLVKNFNPDINDWLMNTLNIIGDPIEIIEEYKNKKILEFGVENKNGEKSENFKEKSEINRVKNVNIEENNKNNDKRILSTKKSLRKQIETKPIRENFVIKLNEAETKETKFLREIKPEEYEYIKVFFKTHQKLLNEIFKKYCKSYKKSGKAETFSGITESFTHLTELEYLKLLKDLNLGALMISQSHFMELVKEYCVLKGKTKTNFNFIEFQDFLIQCALDIYSNPPFDYSFHHPIYSLILLVKNIEKASTDILKNFSLLDKKNTVIEKFDQKLRKNSGFELPSGFSKLLSKEIQVFYSIPGILQLSESQKIVVQIIDEILYSSLKFHILEPQVSIISVYKSKIEVVSQTKTKENTNFSETIKNESEKLISLYGSKIVLEISQVLNDLIIATDSKNILVASPKKLVHLNKIKTTKIILQETKKKEEQEKEKKRLFRVQLVKTKLLKTTTENSKKETDAKKQAEEEKKKILIKKLEEKIQRDREKRLEEIEKWKKAKDEEQKQKEIQEKARLVKEKELRLKKRDEFFVSEKNRLSKLSQENYERKLTIGKIELETLSKQKNNRLKKLKTHKFELEKARKILEEEKVKEQNFLQEYNTENVQKVFKDYEKSLQLIFIHFCQSKHIPNNEELVESSFMNYNEFYKFANQFKITPKIVSQQVLKKYFISIMKSEENSSIKFESFKLLCFKISKSYVSSNEMSYIDSLAEFLNHLELPKDIQSTRNLLRRQEMLKA